MSLASLRNTFLDPATNAKFSKLSHEMYEEYIHGLASTEEALSWQAFQKEYQGNMLTALLLGIESIITTTITSLMQVPDSESEPDSEYERMFDSESTLEPPSEQVILEKLLAPTEMIRGFLADADLRDILPNFNQEGGEPLQDFIRLLTLKSEEETRRDFAVQMLGKELLQKSRRHGELVDEIFTGHQDDDSVLHLAICHPKRREYQNLLAQLASDYVAELLEPSIFHELYQDAVSVEAAYAPPAESAAVNLPKRHGVYRGDAIQRQRQGALDHFMASWMPVLQADTSNIADFTTEFLELDRSVYIDSELCQPWMEPMPSESLLNKLNWDDMLAMEHGAEILLALLERYAMTPEQSRALNEILPSDVNSADSLVDYYIESQYPELFAKFFHVAQLRADHSTSYMRNRLLEVNAFWEEDVDDKSQRIPMLLIMISAIARPDSEDIFPMAIISKCCAEMLQIDDFSVYKDFSVTLAAVINEWIENNSQQQLLSLQSLAASTGEELNSFYTKLGVDVGVVERLDNSLVAIHALEASHAAPPHCVSADAVIRGQAEVGTDSVAERSRRCSIV